MDKWLDITGIGSVLVTLAYIHWKMRDTPSDQGKRRQYRKRE